MKKIWHIGFLDLKLTVKDKAFFFWMLIFPMVFILIFGNLFQGSKTDTKASLTVLNQDQGRWGAYFVEKLEAPGIELTVVPTAPAEYFRMLVIPADFSAKIEKRAAQTLELKSDSEANMQAGAMAETKIVQGMVKLIAELVIYGNQRDIKAFFDSRSPYKDMVLVKTRLPEGTITKVPSGFDHVIPGILVQFVMMMVLVYGGISVMEDRKRRVLARILYSSTSFAELFGGKFLGRVLMGLLQSAILVAAGKLFFHLNLGNVWLSGLEHPGLHPGHGCLEHLRRLGAEKRGADRRRFGIDGQHVRRPGRLLVADRDRAARGQDPGHGLPRLLGHGRLPQGHLLRQGLRGRLAQLAGAAGLHRRVHGPGPALLQDRGIRTFYSESVGTGRDLSLQSFIPFPHSDLKYFPRKKSATLTRPIITGASTSDPMTALRHNPEIHYV